MGRTFDAIQKAEKEFKRGLKSSQLESQEKFALASPQGSGARVTPSRVVDLKTKLLSRYAGQHIKTILITGTAHGCGATTTAVSLATAMAKDSKRNVLLVDGNFRTPGLHRVFGTAYNGGMYDLLNFNGQSTFEFRKVGPGELYLLPSGINRPVQNGYFESNRFDIFLKQVRARFDYVILDSAPVNEFPDSTAMCAKVDGVIIVITYGKTRRQVALRVKKELEDSGANLLGVVFNKRKYYIPDWIYRRL